MKAKIEIGGPKLQYYTVFGVFNAAEEEEEDIDSSEECQKSTWEYLEEYLKSYDENCILERGPVGSNWAYFQTCYWEGECIYIPEQHVRLFVIPGKYDENEKQIPEKADLRWRPYEMKTWLVRFCEFILGSGKVVISESVRDKLDRLNRKSSKVILFILIVVIICLQISKCVL